MSIARALLTLRELSDRLTAELQNVEEAADSRIVVQYQLQEPDAKGCNWSESVVLQVGLDASTETLKPRVAKLVRDAREKFNVKG